MNEDKQIETLGSLARQTLEYIEPTFSPQTVTQELEKVSGKLPYAQWAKVGRTITIKITDDTTAITTGDGKFIFEVPQELNGTRVVKVRAFISTVSSSGAPNITLYNLTNSQEILSTALTIDESEYSSDTATTPAVINQSTNLFLNRDRVEVNIDGAGTGAKGLMVYISVQ